MRYKIIISLFLVLTGISISAQVNQPPFLKYLTHPWVDSVMKSLTLEEKVGQLMWMAAFANRDISYDAELSDQVKKYGIGGVIFFQGMAKKQAEMINYFRTVSKVPPIIAIDGECGIGMRLEEIPGFPYQMTLGAIENDSLIYQMGGIVAKQLKRAGVNINLAPVADVNNNPVNPVINYRSFGENPASVSAKVTAYMAGLQNNGIMAVAKHFPGHGDTEVDSHIDLPVIRHSREHLDSVELLPFRTLINNGISGVMPGHIWVPSLDPDRNIPATLSEHLLTGLLRNEMSFNGLILSDAMNMGGLTGYSRQGESDVIALRSGIDVLEYVIDPGSTLRSVMAAVKGGTLSASLIEEKCRRVLAAKYWAGLNRPVPVEVGNIEKDLFPPEAAALNRVLYSSGLTLLNNADNIIPVRSLEKTRIATLAINSTGNTLFQKRIGSYTRSDNYNIDNFTEDNIEKLIKATEGYDLIIAGVFGTGWRSTGNIPEQEAINTLCARLNSRKNLVLTWFGNPYALGRNRELLNSEGLLLAYQENEFTEELSAQLIFGATGACGRLPVTISEEYPAGSGLFTEGSIRTGYGIPEDAGISSATLTQRIDSIAEAGISAGAYPGCEIMVARKGIVVFNKTYGYHTYDNRVSVSENDLYDLASVTKISSTMAGLMLLASQGRFTPDTTLASYLPYFKRSNKEDMNVREMLAHQAGLTAWIPFWKETVKKDGSFRNRTFKPTESDRYPLKVAEGLYMHRDYRDKIFKQMKKSPVSPEKKYLYSDLTFIIMPGIIEKITGKKWYDYVTEEVYHKIGAWDICFNPWQKYSLSRIVPTEYDSLFRKQLLHGTVHDEGAAMLGGISGHAGLFATANDLMKLMELYRRMGKYGGEEIFSEKIMREYTAYQYPENKNRRGVGFDKPLVNNRELPHKETYPTEGASLSSFGHSGYTGTFVWMDPEAEITFIFLSNRVYPTRNNNKLSELNIRTEILQVIFDSIIR